MKIDVVIVAAGSSARFGGDRPKQYCLLAGRSILQRTVEQFTNHPNIRNVVVVIAKTAQDLFVESFDKNPPAFVIGGASRTQSVFAGLQALQEFSPDRVLIHDGARPFVTTADIGAVIALLDHGQGCAPALPIVDAIKAVDENTGLILADADRNAFKCVQTPQGFAYHALLKAYKKYSKNQNFDDDLSLAMHAGIICKFTAGNPDNIKITTQQDLTKAEQKMITRTSICVTGSGFDVHQTLAGSGMTLCGVFLDCQLALLGHSDADVGLHAITDGLLGAMALGDIGDHFPPSDAQWKNANSEIFLAYTHQLVQKHGGQVVHVDVTLICEAPKIKPYRQQMRQKIAEILNLKLDQVSVKATTTEKLGFTGRGEGIAAQASVTVMKEIL